MSIISFFILFILVLFFTNYSLVLVLSDNINEYALMSVIHLGQII